MIEIYLVEGVSEENMTYEKGEATSLSGAVRNGPRLHSSTTCDVLWQVDVEIKGLGYGMEEDVFFD